MSAPKIRPGATKRLELHTAQFAAATYHLSATEQGWLIQMLMAEVGCRPIPQPGTSDVAKAFEQRRDYSRIMGSFGRGSMPLALRRFVFRRDRERCRYCGEPLIWATYNCDHVKPVALGGGDEPANLAAACKPCNQSKSAKPLKEWLK